MSHDPKIIERARAQHDLSDRMVGSAAPPASEPLTNRSPEVEHIVERWFAEAFHNVELPTQVFNRLRASKDRLKAQIADLLRKD
jgi:hypothetical protein